MKKGVKIGLGIGLAGLACFIGYKIYQKKRNYNLSSNSDKKLSTVAFPLEYGSGIGDKAHQADNVKIVQKSLNNLAPAPFAKLKVDGKMGKETVSLLDSLFQTKQVNLELFNKLKLDA